MIYLTSDHHFGHVNIIKYCDRPYKDIHTMNRTLTNKWNAIIAPQDTVYHLGDIAFGSFERYLPGLNGKIILIKGNHDRGKYYRNYNIEMHKHLDLEYAGYKFKLNHRPVFEPGTHDPFNDSDKHLKIDELRNYDWIICGHVHEKWITKQKNINLSVDVWNYSPVSIDDLIDFIEDLERNN